MEAEVEWNLNASFFPQHVSVFTFLFWQARSKGGKAGDLEVFFFEGIISLFSQSLGSTFFFGPGLTLWLYW